MMTTDDELMKTPENGYYGRAGYENITITSNGRDIARLTSSTIDRVVLWESLLGSVTGGDEVDIKAARNERLEF